MSARVLHVITGLGTGGAEMMLLKLLSRTRSSASVVSLTGEGTVGPRIRELGVRVTALEMRPGLPDPRGLLRLARIIRRERPQVVQTWMYHADLLGGLVASLFPGLPVAWNIRHSNLDPETSKRTTILTAKLCARLSGAVPDRIVSCSETGKRIHAALGYDARKIHVIPNGFDLERYRPDPEAYVEVRRELGLPGDAPLVGLMARWDPQKDHATFVRAAGMLLKSRPDAHFLLCGTGVGADNAELAASVAAAGAGGRMHLLGRRDDVPRLAAALDVAVSSSGHGEGFSNAIGEAMACGVPCVVTEVGDSARIVGDCGIAVLPRDSAALAAGMASLLSLEHEDRAVLSRRVRERIAERFSLEAVADRYDSLHEEMIGG